MRLTFSFRIDKNDEVCSTLKAMSRVSKDLYNQALFEVKKHLVICGHKPACYEATGKILYYSELDKIMKSKTNLSAGVAVSNFPKGNINYRLLPAKVAQQTLMLVSQNVISFFSALSDYTGGSFTADDHKEHPGKYQSRPQFPHFLPKDGHFVLVFTNQQAKIKENGNLKLTRDIAISIPEKEFEKIREYLIIVDGNRIVPLFHQVRIVPKFNGTFFNIEIIYDKDELNAQVDINRVASLDLGVNNLITLVDNLMGEENREPIILNGRPLKSINQYYNKKRADIQAELSNRPNSTAQKGRWIPKHRPCCSKELIRITDHRNEKINDYMHKASRFVINYCLDNKIGHIAIGKNSGWKQSINLGKRNNQNFVAIPFNKLIQQIQYKAQLVGIRVTIIEESYTSKCSALDLEVIGRSRKDFGTYAGKRVKRGLFKTALGLLINVDVNGALNILRSFQK